MMAKAVYYLAYNDGRNRRLYYIDPKGEVKWLEAKENESINTVVSDFHSTHPSAVSLKPEQWDKRITAIAQEKEKLAKWNSMVKGELV